jgi:hypothetical protein
MGARAKPYPGKGYRPSTINHRLTVATSYRREEPHYKCFVFRSRRETWGSEVLRLLPPTQGVINLIRVDL